MYLLWLLLCVLCAPLAGAQNPTAVDVPTWRYDVTHAGQNVQETLLTPGNVNGSSFGKLFSQAVDGHVYAQPLYVSNLTMGDGLVHNVLFVATEHDSIYAFDADTNGGANAFPLWQISLLTPAYGAAAGATTVPSTDLGTKDLTPEIGITGTPAIDLVNKTMYVVGKTKESGVYLQRLHAIDLITGNERPNSPVLIQGSVPGTGNGSSGGQLAFSSEWEMNRGALDFYNGHVYAAFGAHGDNGPWHGWVMGYDATTLIRTGLVCLSPTGLGDGVWGAGAGLPIDSGGSAGRLFLPTGNGTFSNYPPLNGSVNYGESIVALDLTNGSVQPLDAFTSFNQQGLTGADKDLGSGGLLMLPDQQGATPHLLLQAGKEGRIVLLNRDHLGGYASGAVSNTNAVQDIPSQIQGLWSTPAYWNGNVYFWGNGDYPKLFQLNSGLLATTASSQGGVHSSFPGASFVISADGTQNGIAWAARTDAYSNNGSEILYAFDATNLGSLLYQSSSNKRDDAGAANKFNVPVVTNGKVYLAAAYQVNVYGLLGDSAVASAPVISPASGVYTGVQNVTMTTSTGGAAIYYTLDGSLPTPASSLYTAPIPVNTETTVRAIASAPGSLQSAVSAVTLTFNSQVTLPTATPAAGTYNSAQQVTLSDADGSAKIYYTLDGSAPTTASTVYTGPIPVNASTAINAIAADPAVPQPSNVLSAQYVIQAGNGNTINFGNGFASVAGLTLNGSVTNSDDSRLQLTSGAGYQVGSVFYNQAMNIQSFTTDFSFQISNAQAEGFTFTMQNTGLKAIGKYAGALGYGNSASYPGIGKSVAIKFDFYNEAGEGIDSTGVFSNGAYPTVPAVDMTSSGIKLLSGDSIQAHVTYDGSMLMMTLTDPVVNKTFTLSQAIDIPGTIGGSTAYVGFTGSTGGKAASQKILTWTYSSNGVPSVTAAPGFSPAGGSFTAPQMVAISSSTAGASIYYTTDGTVPTAASAKYSGPVSVGTGTTTLNAMAAAAGLSPSSVSSATYMMTAQPGAAPAPVIAPAGGTFSSPQTVTLSDTDAAAAIYYTTDGTQPSAASMLYSNTLTVGGSETIKAIAIDPALQNSNVTSAMFSISSSGNSNSINFTGGFPTPPGLALNGGAAIVGNALAITNGGKYEASSAYYSQPVNVQSFATTFTFQLLHAAADGFTFTLQNAGVTALGGNGLSLGYGGIHRSVALKFDLHNNLGEGPDSTGVFTNGANPTVPAVDLTPSGIVLSSGDTMQAQLSYDGATLVLVLTDMVTNKSATESFSVNIPQMVGGGTAFAGFTGGTGGSSATQNILSWTYGPYSGEPQAAAAGKPQAAAEAVVASALAAAPEPVMMPAPGDLAADGAVRLLVREPGAEIHFTVDGSQPTSQSPVYRAPVMVLGSALTLKAFAHVPGKKDSAVVTGTYHVADGH